MAYLSVAPGGSQSQSTGVGQSSSAPTPFPGALGLYNQLLGLNQSNYNTMLGLYGPAQQNTTAAVNAANTAVSDAGLFPALGGRAINRTFQQANANTELGLINSGLGLNSSELSQFDVQNTLNAGYAYGALTKGLAGQQAQTALQGAGLQQQLTTNEAGNLAGYRFANTFGNLFGQQSQATNNSQSLAGSRQFQPGTGQVTGGVHGLGGGGGSYNPAQQAQADLARAQAAAVRAGTAGVGGGGNNPAVTGFGSQQLPANPYSGGSNPNSWLNSILGGGGSPYGGGGYGDQWPSQEDFAGSLGPWSMPEQDAVGNVIPSGYGDVQPANPVEVGYQGGGYYSGGGYY